MYFAPCCFSISILCHSVSHFEVAHFANLSLVFPLQGMIVTGLGVWILPSLRREGVRRVSTMMNKQGEHVWQQGTKVTSVILECDHGG